MLDFAKNLALEAGKIALEDFAKGESQINTKATEFDIVTETDCKVEEFIISAIKKTYPDHGVFGEETGKQDIESDYCWIIDPIDGTASFGHRLPMWSVSIALYYQNKPLIGVVYAPVLNEIYYAQTGKGAWCNDKRIYASERKTLSESIVCTGFSCLRAKWREETTLPYLCAIAPNVRCLRRHGSAALDTVLTACGKLDAFWELALAPYDIAAGVVIALEAGCKVTDLFGKDEYPQHGFLCCNKYVYDETLSYFKDYKALRR